MERGAAAREPPRGVGPRARLRQAHDEDQPRGVRRPVGDIRRVRPRGLHRAARVLRRVDPFARRRGPVHAGAPVPRHPAMLLRGGGDVVVPRQHRARDASDGDASDEKRRTAERPRRRRADARDDEDSRDVVLRRVAVHDRGQRRHPGVPRRPAEDVAADVSLDDLSLVADVLRA
eukprot:29197-Pelagococcus_subviridis.AAC.10